MRWQSNKKPIIPPVLGSIKTVYKFLWWPKTIDNETRWLEYSVWTEQYQNKKIYIGLDYDLHEHIVQEWIPIKWLNT